MTHTITKLKDSKIEILVEVDKDELKYYVQETEKKIANQMRMGGFRNGKVPPAMVKNKVGEDTIRQEALQLTVQETLTDILKNEKIDMISQEKFDIKENTKDKLVYHVTLVVFPDVELGEYKGITLQRNTINVEKAEIDKILQDVIKSRTIFKTVERPAQLGDRVEVDFTIKDNGTIIDGGTSQNHPVFLGENKFVVGFEENIVGMKTGEEKDFTLLIPSDYFQTAIAGKALDCHAVLKKTEESTVPDLTDEFAKTLGRFETVADLETSAKEGLRVEKENKEKERIRLKILETIAEKTACDLPGVLVEERLEAMLKSFDEELHSMGMELGLYLAHVKKTQEELRDQWRKQAESQVKSSLIMRSVAKQERITISDEELNQELQAILQQYAVRDPSGDFLKSIDIEAMRNRVYSVLLNEKVLVFLENSSKIT